MSSHNFALQLEVIFKKNYPLAAPNADDFELSPNNALEQGLNLWLADLTITKTQWNLIMAKNDFSDLTLQQYLDIEDNEEHLIDLIQTLKKFSR